MVAASSQAKLFDIYHRLIPSSPSSPSSSLSWSLPQSPPWAREEGERGSQDSRRRRKNPTARLRAYCAPLQQESPTHRGQQGGEQFLEEGVGILCEPCHGRGWLICDFCKGVKTNVKAENNRVYRRCPSCRAIGYVLCVKCKVFKCVTFPDYSDGEITEM